MFKIKREMGKMVTTILALILMTVLMGCSISGQNQEADPVNANLNSDGFTPETQAVDWYFPGIIPSVDLPGNLLTEPSFESPYWTSFYGNQWWGLNWFPTEAGVLKLSGYHAKTGSYGLYLYTHKMEGYTGNTLSQVMLREYVPFKPTQRAVAAMWYYTLYPTSIPAGYAYLGVSFFDTNKTLLTNFQRRLYPSDFTNPVYNWQYLVLETPASPANTAFAKVNFGLYKGVTSEPLQLTLAVDDLHIFQVGPTDNRPFGGNSSYATSAQKNCLMAGTYGFRFRPWGNGYITKLGGLFNGKAKVFLKEAGQTNSFFAVDINSTNGWVYEQIVPVRVKGNVEYDVYVILKDGQGARYVDAGLRYPINSYSGRVYIIKSFSPGGDILSGSIPGMLDIVMSQD